MKELKESRTQERKTEIVKELKESRTLDDDKWVMVSVF